MAESTDYKTLKKNMLLFGDRMDRIENGVGVGTPDINYCIAGVEGWIEQKSPIEPKRTATPLFGSNHKLTQDQKNWFMRQQKAGGKGWILISTDVRWILISGRYADNLNVFTTSELLELAAWTTTKPVRDKELWTALRRTLSR